MTLFFFIRRLMQGRKRETQKSMCLSISICVCVLFAPNNMLGTPTDQHNNGVLYCSNISQCLYQKTDFFFSASNHKLPLYQHLSLSFNYLSPPPLFHQQSQLLHSICFFILSCFSHYSLNRYGWKSICKFYVIKPFKVLAIKMPNTSQCSQN